MESGITSIRYRMVHEERCLSTVRHQMAIALTLMAVGFHKDQKNWLKL